MDFDRTREVLAALEREQVRYVVFGGVALNLQGLARATEDLAEITAEDLLGDYPAIQYVPPEGTFHVDILTRLDDAAVQQQAWEAANFAAFLARRTDNR